ncbi:unnamed protein product [Pleuronectes platessa]|uniref:Uncharacterized protein n=1 Tax=Pleuronectes platessa TaxID=8262 RepID=A0A9N7VRL3_PLEPL|nr:unnamed protein product [Pleuronectes platessa]
MCWNQCRCIARRITDMAQDINLPVPADEKSPDSMMLPPPFFTIVMVLAMPLSKAPYSPKICSPGTVYGRSLLCVSCTRWVKSRGLDLVTFNLNEDPFEVSQHIYIRPLLRLKKKPVSLSETHVSQTPSSAPYKHL